MSKYEYRLISVPLSGGEATTCKLGITEYSYIIQSQFDSQGNLYTIREVYEQYDVSDSGEETADEGNEDKETSDQETSDKETTDAAASDQEASEEAGADQGEADQEGDTTGKADQEALVRIDNFHLRFSKIFFAIVRLAGARPGGNQRVELGDALHNAAVLILLRM